MRTGKDREKRDLFAPTEVDQGSIRVKDTLLPPPSFGFTTGSRNENSVLFRVDQLSDVGGRIKTPDPVPVQQHVSRASDAPRDEEGVIDLKSLSSPPPPGTKRSVIPVAPLFSEPPPMTVDAFGTGSRPSIVQNKPISKAKLFGALAAAMVFLVVAGLGISVAFKGEEPVHHAAAVAPPPPAPVVSAAPPPAADPAPASSVASNDDTDAAKKKKKGGKGKKNASGGNASASNQSKAPVKPADPCGCKGDFNCIMACTVKNGH